MYKKRFKSLALALMMLLVLTACGQSKSAGEAPKASSTNGAIVVTDVVGREVQLDKPVTKVVGTHNPTLNAVVVLGGGDRYLAGFGNKEMSRPLYEAVLTDYDGLPQIGKGSNINFEAVAATGAEMAVLPERFKDLVEPFEDAGLKAVVALPNDESFDSVKNTMTLLGQVFGAEERAKEINGFLDTRLDKAKDIAAQAKDKKRVLFLGGSSPLSVAPSAMIQTQLIETAGGINAVEGVDAKGKFVDVSVEQIIAWDPDVIWFPAYTDYTVADLLNDPAWADISAIKNKAVYQFPSPVEPWDQPTAAVSLGVSWALNNLHPELYSKEQVHKDADEFYQFVYGKTFTAEQLGIA